MAKKAADTIDPKKMSVEDKLRALYRLQLIDSEIDKIRTIRGELPLQVQDLEDDIEGLNTRIGKLKSEVKDLDGEISNKKGQIKESEAAIAKYKEQQNNVRNNREYDSLNKEIEFQSLEIQLAEKRIKEFRAKISAKNEIIAGAEEELADRQKDLDHKKGELDAIVGETEKDEKKLIKASEDAGAKIEARLLNAYKRIRTKVKNGLAVVPVERDSAGGSFIQIPPQRILDIAARKKIIIDEHSGRILVDEQLANEETESIQEFLK
tara:strand:- start:12714 stop:13508 length:795 start_codon:yes stop_codon:yes gene_type:complete